MKLSRITRATGFKSWRHVLKKCQMSVSYIYQKNEFITDAFKEAILKI